MTLLMVILFFMISTVLAAMNRAEGYEGAKHIEIYVKEGDTVWDLAREFSPEDQDIRKSIYEISKASNLKSYDIFPGQVIKIPID